MQPQDPGLEKTRVVLLPVDPYLLHAYWKVADPEFEKTEQLLAEIPDARHPVLRFSDATEVGDSEDDFAETFDVIIDLMSKNWYVPVPKPARTYLAELGVVCRDGRFVVLARSNLAETPPVAPASREAEETLLVLGDLALAQPAPEQTEGDPSTAPVSPLSDSRDVLTGVSPTEPEPFGISTSSPDQDEIQGEAILSHSAAEPPATAPLRDSSGRPAQAAPLEEPLATAGALTTADAAPPVSRDLIASAEQSFLAGLPSSPRKPPAS
jgi:hypothetical protein